MLTNLRNQIRDQSLANEFVYRPNESHQTNLERIQKAIDAYDSKLPTKLDREAFDKLSLLLTGWDNYNEPEVTVALSELANYVEGHGDSMFIDRIEAYLVTEDIPFDIVLVDLPGLDVHNQRHIEYTKEYVREKAKAFVVCMKPKHLLEGQEIQFLQEINQTNPTILHRSFWVINQWDTQDSQHRREEESNFQEKMRRHSFNILSARVFKVSALNYFLLNSIANGTLDNTSKLANHLDNLKTIVGDPEQIRTSPDKARSYLSSNEDVLSFAAFRSDLFTYLNDTARKEFVEDAQAALLAVTTRLIQTLEPIYQGYQYVDNPEREFFASEIAQRSHDYLVQLQICIDEFVNSILVSKQRQYWGDPQRKIIHENIQRLSTLDKVELLSQLQQGSDNEGGLQKLPFLLQEKFLLTNTLRNEMVKVIREDFIQELNKLNTKLIHLQKDYLPDKVVLLVGDKLSERDVTMRLYGLADAIFHEYGKKLEGIAGDAIKTPDGLLEARLDTALKLYQDRLIKYADELIEAINVGMRRSVRNHAVYLKDELLKIFEPTEYNPHIKHIRQQISRQVKVSETIAAELARQEMVQRIYNDLSKLSEGL